MQPLALIEHLAATTQRRDKERILREACHAGSDEFFLGARLAYDPFVTFGLAKVAEIIEDDGTSGDYRFAEFLSLADRLYRRHLTGTAARDALHAAAARCDASAWNRFYRCILLKDLRVGIDAKLLNKALRGHPQYSVPLFKCQLPRDGDPTQLHGCKLIDPLLDGMRVVAVLDKEAGVSTLFDCNGHPVPALQPTLQRLLPRFPGSVALDGMLRLPQAPHRLTAVLRDAHSDVAALRLTLFDIMPLADFRAGRCAKPQRERHSLLEVLQESGLWSETAGVISVLPQIEADLDSDAGRSACAEFTRQAVLAGHHGVMLKDPLAAYEGKRTTAWLKHAAPSDLIDD
jgi:DNA ligase-1